MLRSKRFENTYFINKETGIHQGNKESRLSTLVVSSTRILQFRDKCLLLKFLTRHPLQRRQIPEVTTHLKLGQARESRNKPRVINLAKATDDIYNVAFVSLRSVLPHLEGGGQACPSPTRLPNTSPGIQDALGRCLWK